MTNPDQTTDKYAELRSDTLDYLDKCADHFDGTPRLVKRLLAALDEMQGVVERLPKFIDTGKPICDGDEVHELIETKREGVVLGLGRARMIIDDDWDDYAIEGYSTSQAAEAALARDLQDRPARNSSGDSQGEDTDPFPNLHKEHWIRKDDDDTAY